MAHSQPLIEAAASTELSVAAAPALRRTIGRFQFFALGFGTIIGSGWVVVLGDWLQMAGPGGVVAGFLAGGVLMCMVASVYAELCARMPEAGGEFVFTYRIFGARTGFLVGWFVTLYFVAITAFEAIALPWVLQALFPQLKGPVLYEIFGAQVTVDAVVVGAAGVLLVTWFNYRDVRLAVTFQSIVTYGFLSIALLLLAWGASTGTTANLQPLFESPSGRAWWIGAFWIVANTVFFLNGFQAIPQSIEERADGISARTIGRVTVSCVGAAALFYCAVVLFSATTVPWKQLAGTPLAASVAVEHVLPGGLLAKLILIAVALSLLKTWNAIVLMAARILMAQARRSLLPEQFAHIHPRYATPHAAVLFVGACSFCGVLLGRGAVLPIVNMASICAAFALVFSCLALARLRRQEPDAIVGYRAPGGWGAVAAATLGTMLTSLIALFEPLTRQEAGLPLEWLLILAWGALGACFLRKVKRQKQ